jgi:outer membrane protein assembly factor BamB
MVVDKAGTIYAACDDGFLYVAASDGTELTRFETGGWPVYPVIAADNLLILADSKDYSSLEKGAKNTVWALDTRDVEQ